MRCRRQHGSEGVDLDFIRCQTMGAMLARTMANMKWSISRYYISELRWYHDDVFGLGLEDYIAVKLIHLPAPKYHF